MNSTFTRSVKRRMLFGKWGLSLLLFFLVGSLQAQLTNPAPYCKAGPGTTSGSTQASCNNWALGFEKVEFNTLLLDFDIPCNAPGRGDYSYWNAGSFPNYTTSVVKGSTYPLTIGAANFLNTGGYIGSFVDWNKDNDFADAGEVIATSNYSSSFSTYTTVHSVTVPCGAISGTTRMRVRSTDDYNGNVMTGSGGACNVSGWGGETFDFDLTILPPASPTANFIIPDTVFVNSPASFVNVNKIGYTGHQWSTSVAGLGTIVGTGTNFSFRFPSTGTFQVRLTSTNCAGSATVTKNVTVVAPTRKPTVRFLASTNYIGLTPDDVADEIVSFYDYSSSGPENLLWEIYPPFPDKFWFESTIPNTGMTGQTIDVFFADTGTYQVCLTATNSVGATKVCKDAYLIIEYPSSHTYETNMCGLYGSSSLDSGVLYDPGGKNKDYDNADPTIGTQVCRFTIDVCGATEIELTLTDDYFLNWSDYLRVYDGLDNTAPKLLEVGDNQPVSGGLPKTVTAKSGKAYIEFQRNDFDNGKGFELKWKAKKPDNKPFDASFDILGANGDTVYSCGATTNVRFHNTSSGLGSNNPENNQWIFDYDPSIIYPPFSWDSDELSPSFDYNLNKTYKVRYVARTCNGWDTSVRTFVLKSTTAKPTVDFTADQTIMEVGGITTLRNKSYGLCSGSWSISPNTYTIKSGSLTSDILTVQFDAGGRYAIKYTATNPNGSTSLTKTDYVIVLDYCDPTANTTTNSMAINNVKFNTINNSSTPVTPGGYKDHSDNVSTDVIIGKTYNLSIGRTSSYDLADLRAWIDYNRDGIFTIDEVVLQASNTNMPTYTGAVTIPAVSKVVPGPTTMRVALAFSGSGAIDPCGPILIGEYEDYGVNIMVDDVAPVITIRGADSVYMEVNTSYIEAGADAVDNVEGVITPRIVRDNQVDSTQPGIYVVTYDVEDGSGNKAQQRKRYVFVLADMTAPVLTVNGAAVIDHDVNTPYVDLGATAIDNPGSVNISGYIITDNQVQDDKLGTYTVNYSVTDNYGHTTNASRTVNVVDHVKPVINCSSQSNLQVNEPFDDKTSVTDNYWTNITPTIAAGFVNTSNYGATFKVTYNAEDGSGNVAVPVTCTYVITDLIPPVLETLSGTDFMEVEVNSDFIEPTVSGRDNYFPAVTIDRNDGGFDITQLGTYTITYTGTDDAGNTTVYNRTIKVSDRTAPQVVSEPANVMRWTAFDRDKGVSVVDNYYAPSFFKNNTNGCDLYVVTDNVKTEAEGIYQVTYQAIDGSGNKSALHMRTVNVIANTTGIDELSADAFRIYPNPNNGNFDVEFGAPVDNHATITIMNVAGQVVKTYKATDVVNGKLSVNLSDVSAGVYFVQLQSENVVANKKVTITR